MENVMLTANNQSIEFCRQFSKINNLKKDSRRNVIEYNGELYSFSVSKVKNGMVECRQCYGDTVGFITFVPSMNRVYMHRIGHDYSRFSVTRVTSKGIKAFNVDRHINMMTPITNIQLP